MTRAFEICVRGDAPPELLRELGDATVVRRPVETVLVTEPIDQAALHRLLDRLRDLALELGELRRLPPPRRRRCALPDLRGRAG